MFVAHTIRSRWFVGVAVALLAALMPVAVHAVDWGPIGDLSSAGQFASEPEVAMSADGTRAVAVWYRWDGTNQVAQTRSAVIADGTATWGAVTSLTGVGDDASSPQVAVSADGTRATAVWYVMRLGEGVVQSASATVSGNVADWGATQDLSALGQDAVHAQLGLSANGTRATAVWQRADGGNYVVESKSATISGSTAVWGSVTELSQGAQSAGLARVGVSADGTRATAMWQQSDGANFLMRSASAAISGASADWSSVTDLSAAGANAEAPDVAVSANGLRAAAVWYRWDGSHQIAQSRSATVDGKSTSWGPVVNLSAPGEEAGSPQIALSSDGGRATAVWQRERDSENFVQSASATISGTAQTWGPVSDLTSAGQNAEQPKVALSADGSRVTAVWTTANDMIARSRSALVDATTQTWGPLADVSTPGGRPEPEVAASSDGRQAVAVWLHFDGSTDVVQSRAWQVFRAQQITFPAPPSTQIDKGPVSLRATVSSGLPVTYDTSTPGVCAVSGATVTLKELGACVVTAHQSGNVAYAPAPDVTQAFTVTPIASPPTPPVPGKPKSVRVTSKKGKVIVKWAASNKPVTKYTVQTSTTKKKWKKAGTAGPTATKFVWKKGTRAKTYYVRVRATSLAGRGPWSKPVKVKVR